MTWEFRYIPHIEADAWRARGWRVKPMRGYHGLYSMLAWREFPL